MLLYIFAAGIAAYLIFKSNLLFLFTALILFEITVYLVFRNYNVFWSLKERITYNVVFFLGYFSLFIIYEDFDQDFYIYNNNIK